tara:strand:- start:1526 stop:2044 length:519 start_codon:yes stop_codon:yes gene_type:complete
MAFWDKMKKALVGDSPAPEEKKAPAASGEKSPGAGAASAAPAAGASAEEIGDFKSVRVEHGLRGWGGPLTIQPTKQRNLIYSVTGGGIHPVAQKIADLTGASPFDGFKSKADFEQIACAVIDCGGTARVGVYPMKGIPTIDIHAATPSGPLAKYINETNFVSGVKEDNVTEA